MIWQRKWPSARAYTGDSGVEPIGQSNEGELSRLEQGGPFMTHLPFWMLQEALVLLSRRSFLSFRTPVTRQAKRSRIDPCFAYLEIDVFLSIQREASDLSDDLLL